MTVGELIKQLQAFPENERVKVIVRNPRAPHVVPGIFDDEGDCPARIEQVTADNGARDRVVIEAWS